ncbi:MAG TPA: GIY-YIG nuclease family protein [Pyrinomonadaceae bacterium]|nr:GIY-YIG nuclease family protein [Pyrinomonadaceae bacterium]
MPLRQRLYIMHCRGTPYYKIGISWAARQRVVDIRRAVKAPVDIIAEFDVPNARAEEKALHQMYAAYRVRLGNGDGCTEWFSLPHAEAGVLTLLLTCTFASKEEIEAFTRQLAELLGEALKPVQRLPIFLTRKQALEVTGRPLAWLEKATRGESPRLRHIGRGRAWRVHHEELLKFAESFREEEEKRPVRKF